MLLSRLLAKMKGLRGSKLDVFGYAEARVVERRLIGEFEQSLELLLAGLTADKLKDAAEIVELTRQIDTLIDAEIAASLADMQKWTAELTPITAELRSFAANIDGVVVALGLIDRLLQVVVAIVALIV